jgi:hypothetical protein
MTHISTHPPGEEETYFSNSPVIKMFGYLTIKSGKKQIRVLFFNNTGYEFRKKTPVGCHLQLIPLRRDDTGRKKFAAIAFDLEEYEAHTRLEERVIKALTKASLGARLKLENLSVESVESYLQANPDASEDDQRILRETCNYMRTDSFRQIYYEMPTRKSDPAKKRANVEQWIIDNVVDLDVTKRLIFGSGRADGSQVVEIPEFKRLMNQYFKKPTSSGKKGNGRKRTASAAKRPK